MSGNRFSCQISGCQISSVRFGSLPAKPVNPTEYQPPVFRRETVGEKGMSRRGVGRQLRCDAEKGVFGVAESDFVPSFRTVGGGTDDDDAS